MKATKRTFSLLLLLVLICSVLPSCADKTALTETTAHTTTNKETETVKEEEKLSVSDKKYNSFEFEILLSGNLNNSKTANDFGGTVESEEILEAAKYKRKVMVEQLYDIKIVDINKIKYNSATGAGPGYQAFFQSYMSSSFDYSIGMLGTYDVGVLAYSGFLTKLSELPHVNLEYSWWDQTANEQLTVKDKLFYTTGDIGILDNIVTHCVMFNKDMIKDKKLENPYEMVRNNTWTLDNFISFVKLVGNDLDGNTVMNEKDEYGLLTWNDSMYSMLGSAQIKICSVNSNGDLELTINNEKTFSLLSKYIALVADKDHVYNYQVLPSGQWDTVRVAMFDNNQALFSYTSFNTVPKHRNSNTDFGILPFPKLDENQENYTGTSGMFSNMFFCVPYFVEDMDRTGAISEALAYYGKEVLTPAYYEYSLKGSYIRDDDSAEMLDILFANRSYDLGIIYKVGGISAALVGMVTSRTDTFASVYASLETKANTELAVYNERFGNILD